MCVCKQIIWCHRHYSNVIMGAMASQITSFTIVYSIVYPGADQRKHQSSASLAFERGIHWWPVNSLHKWPVAQKMFPFDDVIMELGHNSKSCDRGRKKAVPSPCCIKGSHGCQMEAQCLPQPSFNVPDWSPRESTEEAERRQKHCSDWVIRFATGPIYYMVTIGQPLCFHFASTAIHLPHSNLTPGTPLPAVGSGAP